MAEDKNIWFTCKTFLGKNVLFKSLLRKICIFFWGGGRWCLFVCLFFLFVYNVGNLVILGCGWGTYGFNCNETCQSNCSGNLSCDPITGICPQVTMAQYQPNTSLLLCIISTHCLFLRFNSGIVKGVCTIFSFSFSDRLLIHWFYKNHK